MLDTPSRRRKLAGTDIEKPLHPHLFHTFLEAGANRRFSGLLRVCGGADGPGDGVAKTRAAAVSDRRSSEDSRDRIELPLQLQ